MTARDKVCRALDRFAPGDLPPFLRDRAVPFGMLADRLAAFAPDSPHTAEALRLLLRARDAHLRAPPDDEVR